MIENQYILIVKIIDTDHVWCTKVNFDDQNLMLFSQIA